MSGRNDLKARMIREARALEARALCLEHPSGECSDPLGAAALYSIAALVYRASPNATHAERAAGCAVDLKAEQAERREAQRRAAEPQTELF